MFFIDNKKLYFLLLSIFRRLSQKSKFFTTKGTKDFHKEHNMLINNVLHLCPFVCTLWLKRLLKQPPRFLFANRT